MRKTLFLTLAIALLASCQPKTTQLNFGIASCYQLNKGEEEAKVDREALKLYNNELRIDSVESYINKLVQSKTVKMYFSLIPADKPEQVMEKMKADSSITIMEEKNKAAHKTTFHIYKIKKKSGVLVGKILFRKTENTNPVMIDAVYATEEDLNKFYLATDDFIERLVCKNEK